MEEKLPLPLVDGRALCDCSWAHFGELDDGYRRERYVGVGLSKVSSTCFMILRSMAKRKDSSSRKMSAMCSDR